MSDDSDADSQASMPQCSSVASGATFEESEQPEQTEPPEQRTRRRIYVEPEQPERSKRRIYRRRPPQPKLQTFDMADSTKLPTHLRHRYWTSWEEMRLVELWRKHSDQIVTLLKNTPIFRVISDGMKLWGFHVNSQECRRKISSLKNRYILESRRMRQEKTESEWKLYPLIHCLLVPSIKNPELCHEIKIVNQLLAKMPPLPTELKPPAPPPPQIKSYQRHTQVPHINRVVPRPPQHRTLPYELPKKTQPKKAPIPPTAASTTPTTTTHLTDELVAEASAAAPPPPAKRKYVWRNLPTDVSYMFKHHFTQPRLELLRAENLHLAECRDQSLKQLHIAEREYECLVSYSEQWTSQQQEVLQRLNMNAM